MDSDMTITLILFAVFFMILFYIYYRAQQRIKQDEELQNIERSLMQYNLIYSRQENDVWNISGRMNSQNLDSWPTHDHHVSIEPFVFPPDYQAKDPRLAPPPYTEVDLPTYEEAVACVNNKNSQQQQPVPLHTISATRQENA